MKNRLKVLRAERDWTQAQLATELEVSRQTVNAHKPCRGLPIGPQGLLEACRRSTRVDQKCAE